MVKIPTTTANRQLTTQTTANPIRDIDSFTKSSRATQQAGQALGAIAEDFKRLDTLRSVSRATVEVNNQLTALEDESLNSADLTESSVVNFGAESTNIINNALSTIGDEEARLRLGVQFEGVKRIKGFNIKRNGRNLDVANAQLETEAVEKQALSDILKDKSGVHQDMIRGNLLLNYNNQIASGYKTSEQMQQRIIDFDEAIRVGRADKAVLDDPVLFLEMQEEFDITLDERTSLVRLANSLISNQAVREQRQLTKVQIKTSRDRALDLYDINRNDAEIIQKLKDDLASGNLKESSFISKMNVILSKKSQQTFNDPAVINTIAIEAIRLAGKDSHGDYNNASAEDIAEFETLFEAINQGLSDGKITTGSINTILKPILPVIDKALDDKATEQAIKENPKKGFDKLNNWVNSLGPVGAVIGLLRKDKKDDFRLEDFERIKAELTTNLFEALANPNVDIDQATNQIIKDKQNEIHPEWSGVNIGDEMSTSFGLRKVKGFFTNGEPDIELLPEDLKAMERRKIK